MNWYVLYCQSLKIDQLCEILNSKEDIKAFVPKMEMYRRDRDYFILEKMFPGYLFVLTHRDQKEFEIFLMRLGHQKNGLIRELKKEGVSALTQQEMDLFSNLLNQQGILKISYGEKINGRSIANKGPLVHYSDNIKRVDFYRNIAYLDIQFLGRDIICGFVVKRYKQN